jgi:hypothetical protein
LEKKSHISGVTLLPRKLSTEFVHNYVDRGAYTRQSPSPGKGLRQDACTFANCGGVRSTLDWV